MSLPSVQRMLEEGAAQGVYPMAQACVLHQGKRVFGGSSGGATAATAFDLASLTKVMCTTSVWLSLWAERRLGPDTRVESIFPQAAVGGEVTLADLLFHRSGLPGFVPLFAEVMRRFPALRDPACPPASRVAAREEAVRLALQVPPERPRHQAAVYSDLGFIVLGEILASVSGQPLEALFLQRVASPLGLSARFVRMSAPPPSRGQLAPTGGTRPRPPAPGQELLWDLPSTPSADVGVDDDNAWVMDGVAGHAGLFGTAEDVARWGQTVLEGLAGRSPLAPASLWEQCVQVDVHTPGSTRALGFDTPAATGSSAGRYLGRGGAGAVGHLGFTGCSVWVDLSRQLVVALLTNRSFLGRDHDAIREFRPRFHDEVVSALSLT